MTSERQFLLHGEDADANTLLAFGGSIARQDESRLGEIHLPGKRLHLRIGQSATVRKYRQRVALERTRSEHVPLRHGERLRWLAHDDFLTANFGLPETTTTRF